MTRCPSSFFLYGAFTLYSSELEMVSSKWRFLFMFFSRSTCFVQVFCSVACCLLVSPRSFLCSQLRTPGICLPVKGRTRPHILQFSPDILMQLCSGFNASKRFHGLGWKCPLFVILPPQVDHLFASRAHIDVISWLLIWRGPVFLVFTFLYFIR